jgi:hypothetical protein
MRQETSVKNSDTKNKKSADKEARKNRKSRHNALSSGSL